MKQQVLVIHGGDTFDTREEYIKFLKEHELDFQKMMIAGWKENLRSDLGDDYEVILPKMPNNTNATYEEWEIMFGKLIPFLHDGLILVGHSMGGLFLAKYLSENNFKPKVRATFLVAAPFGDNLPEYELYSFSLPKKIDGFARQAGQVFIFHSSDDLAVPPRDSGDYKNAVPNSELKMFTDRGHFGQPHLPELVEVIKKLA
ncbi:MAG: alpha/beta hydrolase [Patescibacteria group bacterium]|mgnify:CR=1 FL=1